MTKVDMATARRIAGKIISRLACGHYNTDLANHWALMGALEALNGLLLSGLATAFLFAVAQRVWPLDMPEGGGVRRVRAGRDGAG